MNEQKKPREVRDCDRLELIQECLQRIEALESAVAALQPKKVEGASDGAQA